MIVGFLVWLGWFVVAQVYYAYWFALTSKLAKVAIVRFTDVMLLLYFVLDIDIVIVVNIMFSHSCIFYSLCFTSKGSGKFVAHQGIKCKCEHSIIYKICNFKKLGWI